MNNTSLIKREESSLVKRRSNLDLARPSAESRETHLRDTKNAIDKLIAIRSGEITVDKSPKVVEYITKDPNETKFELKIVEKQNDPLEPPRHRYRKTPMDLVAATEDTRAPILRPPPKKLTAEEKKKWDVPASISNWKNDRGFLIDLETRAASTEQGKPMTPQNHEAKSSLAAALSLAVDEIEDEKKAEEDQLNAQNELRAKLLSQKQKSQTSDLNEDMFDSRLFHSSKRKHDVYSESLFSKKGRPRRKRIDFEK